MKRIIPFLIFIFWLFALFAQKELNATETGYVEEAKNNLLKALSSLDMSDENRAAVLKRSAVTLKEYGQPMLWSVGDPPVKEIIDQQYEQCKNEIISMSDLALKLENQNLRQRLKIINSMQFDVMENQIQMLIPGSTPVQLSIDAVNTVFGMNIADGITGGRRSDAKELKNKFKQLNTNNEFIKYLNVLIDNHHKSLKLIDTDRKELPKKIEIWKQGYMNAYNGAFTFKGYEGAVPMKNFSGTIFGTWKFGFPRTGYFYWTFSHNGDFIFEDKMNKDSEIRKGKFTVTDNALRISVTEGDTTVEGVYYFVIESNKLRFTHVEDPDISRMLTLRHVWTRD